MAGSSSGGAAVNSSLAVCIAAALPWLQGNASSSSRATAAAGQQQAHGSGGAPQQLAFRRLLAQSSLAAGPGHEMASSSSSSSSSRLAASLHSWLRPLPPLSPQMQLFLTGLCILAALNTLFTLARAFSFAYAGLQAAHQLHRRLLTALLKAPMSFFDSTPHGRVVNRFSSDTNTVDDSLPFIMNILLANAVSLALVLAVLAYSQPQLLVLLLPLALLYRCVGLCCNGMACMQATSDDVQLMAPSCCVLGMPWQQGTGRRGHRAPHLDPVYMLDV
jgi:ABC-type multidrug transport system fused ATPase/permease subunit